MLELRARCRAPPSATEPEGSAGEKKDLLAQAVTTLRGCASLKRAGAPCSRLERGASRNVHEVKKREDRKRKREAAEPRHITRAVTHIGLKATNAVKLAVLDALAPIYLALCQQYVDVFCTEEPPDALRTPLY